MRKIFTLLILLLLLPVTALAEEGAPNTLYVGDKGLSVANDSYWTTDANGKLTQSAADQSWNVKYDPSTATLTLSGATIQGGNNTGSVPYGAGIYALCSSNQPVALTIELIGENTITGYYGIYVNAEISADSYGTDASLTITGESNGSLKVSGSYHGIYVKSGTGGASLNINDASVVASSSSSHFSYAGVYVQSSAHATSSPQLSLKVNGGSLTASGSASGEGIKFYVGAFEATSATTSLTVTDNAIVDAKNGGISAKQISNPINTDISATGSSGGIVFNGNTGTVYGDVTLDESLTINQGETLTVPEGSSLTVPEDKTITVESGGKLDGTPTGGTVVYGPTITKQPEAQSVTVGQTATFTITANGSEPLSYKWQYRTNSGTNWNDIPDATDNNYTTEAVTLDMNNYQYQCVVSNSAGSVTSNAATLTVKHNLVKVEAKAPTCTETGNIEYWYCEGCDKYFSDPDGKTEIEKEATVIPVTDHHDWGKTVYKWSEYNTACTATRTCKNDASHTETAEATVTSEQTQAPTCTEPGKTTYTATFKVNWTKKRTKTVADIPATGHHYVNGYCTECGHRDPDYVDPISYYNIYVEDVCDGVEVSTSKQVVREGGSINVYVEKDTARYTFDNFKVYYKRIYYGTWDELKEGTQPGEYPIKNIWNHIYIKAEGAEEKEDPTGIEQIEGVKVYTKDGSLYVQTPQREQVIIVSMSGAVVKNEEQIGLKQYHGLQPGIYIVRVGDRAYKVRLN